MGYNPDFSLEYELYGEETGDARLLLEMEIEQTLNDPNFCHY